MFDKKTYREERLARKKEYQKPKPITDLSVFMRSTLPRQGQVNHDASREQKRQHKARMITRRNQ
jgi:hypothetical protein